MIRHDVARIREAFALLAHRANESLGTFNADSVGIGRYLPGSSPWEKHGNGDELLLVTDGEVQIEVLDEGGDATVELLQEGSLFVVPRDKWHQLTATNGATILYVSPGEDGATRQRAHPFAG